MHFLHLIGKICLAIFSPAMVCGLALLLNGAEVTAQGVMSLADLEKVERAEKFLAEGNYDSALENYQRLAKMDLEETARRWVQYRMADIPLQKELMRPRVTMEAVLKPMREGIAALLQPSSGTTRSRADDEIIARIHESLGDSHWLLQRNPGKPGAAQRNLGLAWTQYRAALDYWAGSTDLPRARERTLAILHKVLRPLRRGEPGEDVLELVPEYYIRRGASIAERPEDKVTLKLAMALRLFPRLAAENRENVRRLLAEALELAPGTPLMDEALWQNARFYELFGKIRPGAPLGEDSPLYQPDLPAAMALYRQLAEKVKSADSSFPEEAVRRMAELTAPALSLKPAGQFLPGSQVSFLLNSQNLASAEFTLYRLDLVRGVELARTNGAPAAGPAIGAEPFFLGGIKPTWAQEMRSWPETDLDQGNYEPTERLIQYQGMLETGAYLLEARAKGLTARTVLLVGDLRAAALKSGHEALVWVVGTISGKPVAGAEVVLWARQGSNWAELKGTTDEQGLAKFSEDSLAASEELLALARKEAAQTYTIWEAEVAPESHHAPVMTALRLDAGGSANVRWMLLAPGSESHRPARFELRAGMEPLAKGPLAWNDYGVAIGEGVLPEKTPPGAGITLAVFDDAAGRATSKPPTSIFPLPAAAQPNSTVEDEPNAAESVTLRILGQENLLNASPRPVLEAGKPLTINILATNTQAFPVSELPLEANARTLGGTLIWQESGATNSEGMAAFTLPAILAERTGGGLIHLSVTANPPAGDPPLRTIPDAEVETLLAFGNGHPLLKLSTAKRIYAPGTEVSADLRAVNPWGQVADFVGEARLLRLTRTEKWSNPLAAPMEGADLAKARAEVPSFPPPPAADGRLDWARLPSPTEETLVATREVRISAETGFTELKFTPVEPGFYEIAVGPAGEQFNRVEPVRTLFMAPDPAGHGLGWFPAQARSAFWPETIGAVKGLVFGMGPGQPQLVTLENGGYKAARVLTEADHMASIELQAAPPAGLTLTSLGSSLPRQYRVTVPAPEPPTAPAELKLELAPGQTRPGAAGALWIPRPAAGEEERRVLVWLERADRISLPAARQRGKSIAGFTSLRPAGGTAGKPASLEESSEATLPLVYGAAGKLLRKPADFWEPWDNAWASHWEAEDGHPGRSLALWPGAGVTASRGPAQESDPAWIEAAFPGFGDSPESEEAPPLPPVPGRGARILAEALDVQAAPGEGAPPEALRVEVPFRWPDTPGGWRLAVLALDRQGQTSYAYLEREVQEPLEFSISAPPFLRARDSVDIEVALENYSETVREVSLDLSVKGGVLHTEDKFGTPTVRQLAAGERQTLAWRIQPLLGEKHIDLTLKLNGSEEFSATRELRIPILNATADDRDRRQARAIVQGQNGAHGKIQLDWEEDGGGALEKGVRVRQTRLRAYPGLGAVAVTSARRLLHQTREAGSLEETLSGILPAALLAADPATQDLAGGRDPLEKLLSGQLSEVAAKPADQPPPLAGQPTLLADRVRTALDTLAAQQFPEGGWPWAPGAEEPDLFASAYAVWALALLRDTGWNLRPDVLSRGAGYLEEQLADAPSSITDLELQAWALNALTAARRIPGQPAGRLSNSVSAVFDNLWSQYADLTPGGQALYILSLIRNGPPAAREHLKPAREILAKGAIFSQPAAPGAGPDAPPEASPAQARWGITEGWAQRRESAVDSTALALLALPSEKDAPEWADLRCGGVHWLAEQLLSDEPDSPDALARALGGIALAQEARPPTGPFSMVTSLGGPSPVTREFTAEMSPLAPLEVMVEGGTVGDIATGVEADLQFTGAGTLWLEARLETIPPAEPASAEGVPSPRMLRRSFVHAVSRPTLFEGNILIKEPVAPGSPIRRGEEVEMLVDLSVPRKGLTYASLRLPLPAGLVPLSLSKGGPVFLTPLAEDEAAIATQASARMQARLYEGGALLLTHKLPAGDWRLVIPLRAPHPGIYHLPPAELDEGYLPGAPTLTGADRLEVLPERVDTQTPTPPASARGEEPHREGPG